MDRIDIHVEVSALGYDELSSQAPGECSGAVRARVEAARERQRARFADACTGGTASRTGTGSEATRCNADMGARQITRFCPVDDAGHAILERAIDRLGMSARAHSRILKVARTIADLAGSETIEAAHVAEAAQYRKLDRRRPG